MKFIYLLINLFLMPTALAEINEKFGKCLVNHPLTTPERILRALDLQVVLNQNEKCLLACGLDYMGIFEDGRFSKLFQLVIRQIYKINSISSHKEAQALGKCSKVTDENSCNLAYKFIKCLKISHAINPLIFVWF